MKIIFRFCVAAILCVGALSCTKSSSSDVVTPPSNTEPFIFSNINRTISQPSQMVLGTESSVLHVGNRVTIFVPYTMTNDAFVSTTITVADKLSDAPIRTYELISSEDDLAAEIVLPDNMRSQSHYLFATFVLDGSYANKSVTLKSRLQGQTTSSSDELIGAFSVAP